MALGCDLSRPARLYESGASADFVTNDFSGESVSRVVSGRAGGRRRKWRFVCAVSHGGVILTRLTSVLLEIRSGACGRSLAGERVLFSGGVLVIGTVDGHPSSPHVAPGISVRPRGCGRISRGLVVHKLGGSRDVATSGRSGSGVGVLCAFLLVC